MRPGAGAAVAALSGCVLALAAGRHEETWTPLLDKDLSQWETYLSYALKPGYAGEQPRDDKGNPMPPIGYNKNVNGVFSLIEEGGQPVVRISGEIYGCLFTKREFRNYQLRLQVRWGTKKWDPRLHEPMDSGILYHSQGECGRDYWRSWMLSQEFQIMEGGFGDYWSQMTSLIDVRARKAPGATNYRYDPEAPLLSFGYGSGNSGYCQRRENHESPTGTWNSVELICFEGDSLHIVNGHAVMALSHSRYLEGAESRPLVQGKIQLQSEAAEVFYKDIRIRPIAEMPREYASYFRARRP
jgi:hypothetical protein